MSLGGLHNQNPRSFDGICGRFSSDIAAIRAMAERRVALLVGFDGGPYVECRRVDKTWLLNEQ